MKIYEAMFLVPSARAKENFNGVREHIAELVKRGNGELINCERWDDRKLCFPIRKHRRATYVISHFRAPPDGLVRIERASRLSETVLRVLILVDEDGLGTEPPAVESDFPRPWGDRRPRPPAGSDRRPPAREEAAPPPPATPAPAAAPSPPAAPAAAPGAKAPGA